jgi:hypothetical protein
MYCGSCGTMVNPGARFCRTCGSPQAAGVAPPPPPPPVAPGRSQAGAQTSVVAGLLAIAGGVTFCLLTLQATIYQPLHNDYPVNYGDSVQFGDVLTFALGAGAIVLGTLLLTRPGNVAARGWGLFIAGLSILTLAVVWAFGDLIDILSQPFYFGYVYFAEFGRVEAGSHLVQVPLLIAAGMVAGAGLLALSSRRQAPSLR